MISHDPAELSYLCQRYVIAVDRELAEEIGIEFTMDLGETLLHISSFTLIGSGGGEFVYACESDRERRRESTPAPPNFGPAPQRPKIEPYRLRKPGAFGRGHFS